MEQKSRSDNDICPICLAPIEAEDEVIRVMDQPVHSNCFREQSESWTAA
ncbi:MAG: hypothetical protein HYX72_05650 [Acidobacteria bacterium]|nr:hypothetical protein [Acidobacteriota bacterium]